MGYFPRQECLLYSSPVYNNNNDNNNNNNSNSNYIYELALCKTLFKSFMCFN